MRFSGSKNSFTPHNVGTCAKRQYQSCCSEVTHRREVSSRNVELCRQSLGISRRCNGCHRSIVILLEVLSASTRANEFVSHKGFGEREGSRHGQLKFANRLPFASPFHYL